LICQEARGKVLVWEQAEEEVGWEVTSAEDREVIVSARVVARKLSISRGFPAIPSSVRNAAAP
jgi:hypothetical protein